MKASAFHKTYIFHTKKKKTLNASTSQSSNREEILTKYLGNTALLHKKSAGVFLQQSSENLLTMPEGSINFQQLKMPGLARGTSYGTRIP